MNRTAHPKNPKNDQIKNQTTFSKRQFFYFVIAFGLIGGYFLIKSFAAPLPASQIPVTQQASTKANISDLTDLLSTYKQPSQSSDLDHNGSVDLKDLSILLSNYGKP